MSKPNEKDAIIIRKALSAFIESLGDIERSRSLNGIIEHLLESENMLLSLENLAYYFDGFEIKFLQDKEKKK